MASPCAIERDQLLQLRSGYEATKTIGLSVHLVCVQKTSGKIVDLVCCQDLCAKSECSVQLLVAVKVLGRSLGKFSPEKNFSSPACFEEIWPFADREWRDDALLLVGKVLFLNTRCMATWRAATTAQGQFVAARTYRRVLSEAWGFLVTSFGRDCRSQADHRRVVPEHTSFVQVRSCGVGLRPNNGVRSSVLCNAGCDP